VSQRLPHQDRRSSPALGLADRSVAAAGWCSLLGVPATSGGGERPARLGEAFDIAVAGAVRAEDVIHGPFWSRYAWLLDAEETMCGG
jgi:hypothetical protein